MDAKMLGKNCGVVFEVFHELWYTTDFSSSSYFNFMY